MASGGPADDLKCTDIPKETETDGSKQSDTLDKIETGGPADDTVHINATANSDLDKTETIETNDEIVRIKSSDGVEIEVKRRVIEQCVTLKNMFEDLGEDLDGKDTVVPVPNVDGETLKKIVEFCEAHAVCHFSLPC